MSKTTLAVTFPAQSAARLEELQRLTDSSTAEVLKNALRIYDHLVRKGKAVEDQGGVLYLTVKYPDGRTEEEEIFEEE